MEIIKLFIGTMKPFIRKMNKLVPESTGKLLTAGRNLNHAIKTKLRTIIRIQSYFVRFVVILQLLVYYGFTLYKYFSSDDFGQQVETDLVVALHCWYITVFCGCFFFDLVVEEIIQLFIVFGWKRVLLYLLSVSLFSCFFVTVPLDSSCLWLTDKATEAFKSRFENNTMTVKENRACFDYVSRRPLPDETDRGLFGKNYVEFHQLHRYLMEDAQFYCTGFAAGFPGGRPIIDQVHWRRNGVPMNDFSDRFSHVISFKEMPSSDIRLNVVLREVGYTLFQITSKLKIFLLEAEDFASYTCHIPEKINVATTPNTHKKNNNSSSSSSRVPPPGHCPEPVIPVCQCSQSPDKKWVFQDSITHTDEFRLIRIEESQEQIIAPPSSILFFETAYFHLSPQSDVEMDYMVGDMSYQDLCNDSFHGCSALQRLWAAFINDPHLTWNFFWSLPLQLRRPIHTSLGGDSCTMGHCLCENSFGHHSMVYLRKYYNRTSGQFQLFEIKHPKTLLVRPPDQNSFHSFFSNYLSFDVIRQLEVKDYLPAYAYDLVLLKDFAVAATMMLNVVDVVLILIFSAILSRALYYLVLGLETYGCISKRLCLYGSLGYFSTALLTLGPKLQRLRAGGQDDEEHFDFYLCHPDTEIARKAITETLLPVLEDWLRLKVCLRDRDIPPNMPETLAIDRVLEKSKRFIILYSKELLQDGCREHESQSILETVWDRQSKQLDILVVKLDDSEVLSCWKDFEVHDWTSSNLGQEDQKLRMIRWVAANSENRSLMSQGVLGAVLTLMPISTVCILLVFGIFSRFF